MEWGRGRSPMLVPKGGRLDTEQALPLAVHHSHAYTRVSLYMKQWQKAQRNDMLDSVLKHQVHPTALHFMAKYILLHHLHLVHFIPSFNMDISHFNT